MSTITQLFYFLHLFLKKSNKFPCHFRSFMFWVTFLSFSGKVPRMHYFPRKNFSEQFDLKPESYFLKKIIFNAK